MQRGAKAKVTYFQLILDVDLVGTKLKQSAAHKHV